MDSLRLVGTSTLISMLSLTIKLFVRKDKEGIKDKNDININNNTNINMNNNIGFKIRGGAGDIERDIKFIDEFFSMNNRRKKKAKKHRNR